MWQMYTNVSLQTLGASEVLAPDAFSCNLAMKACEMGHLVKVWSTIWAQFGKIHEICKIRKDFWIFW
jgi:hypothetical protein